MDSIPILLTKSLPYESADVNITDIEINKIIRKIRLTYKYFEGWELNGSMCFFTYTHLDLFHSHPSIYTINIVKPVNKGHPRERQNMVFIDKWSLFGDYFIKERLLKCDLLLQSGPYLEVAILIWKDILDWGDLTSPWLALLFCCLFLFLLCFFFFPSPLAEQGSTLTLRPFSWLPANFRAKDTPSLSFIKYINIPC